MPQLGDEYSFSYDQDKFGIWTKMSRVHGNDYNAEDWDSLFKGRCLDGDIFCCKTNSHTVAARPGIS